MDGVETGNAPGPDRPVRQQRRRSRAVTGRSRLVSRVLSLERGASFSMGIIDLRAIWGLTTTCRWPLSFVAPLASGSLIRNS